MGRSRPSGTPRIMAVAGWRVRRVLRNGRRPGMVGSIFASCSTLLAASSRGGGEPSDVIKYILLWSGGLVVVIVLGMWAAAHLKRRYQQQSDHPTAAAGFTLSDLRQLHRSGQMTDEEFERAKAK